MVIMIPNIKIRKVSLTNQEIEFIIESLEYLPHSIFEFLNHQKLVNKLKKAK